MLSLTQDVRNQIVVIINKLPTDETVALKQMKYLLEKSDDPVVMGACWSSIHKITVAGKPMFSLDFSNTVDGCDVGGCLSVVNMFYRTIIIAQTYEMRNKQKSFDIVNSIGFMASSDTTVEAFDMRLNSLIKFKVEQALSANDVKTGLLFVDAEKTADELVYTYKRTTEYRPTTKEINTFIINAKNERVGHVIDEASLLIREWLKKGKVLKYVFLDANGKQWGSFVLTENDVRYEETKRELES